MLLKAGVDISRLDRRIRRKLDALDRLYKNNEDVLVITSTYEGTHIPSSLHYANLAIDINRPKKEIEAIMRMIITELGGNYDVVFEGDHIHIEYDPAT